MPKRKEVRRQERELNGSARPDLDPLQSGRVPLPNNVWRKGGEVTTRFPGLDPTNVSTESLVYFA